LKKALYGLKQSPRARFGKFMRLSWILVSITRLKQLSWRTFTLKILANFGTSWELKLQDLSKASIYLRGSMYLTSLKKLDCWFLVLVDTPTDPNQKLLRDEGELFSDPSRYRRLIGKLNYLTITRLDISYAISVVS
jgi:hypothetical protein